MAGNDAATKFFDALNEGYDALIDAVRASNDRGHRFSAALLEDVQRGQRESMELTRKWADAPLDFSNFYGTVLEATTKAQGRALEVSRQWFGELADAQGETRDALQKMVNANRHAGEAAVDLARGLFSRASQAVQTAGQQAVSGGDGRRTSREPARTGASDNSDA